jgi:hypothetical protein
MRRILVLVAISTASFAAGHASGAQFYVGTHLPWLRAFAEVATGGTAAFLVLSLWREPSAAARTAAWSYLPWYGLGLSWMAYIGYFMLGVEAAFIAYAVRVVGRLSWGRAFIVAIVARAAGLVVRLAMVRMM